MKGDLEHPPGSPEAAAQGCTCSPILNRHGRGTLHGDPPFYVSKQCPIHGTLHTPGKDDEVGGVPALPEREDNPPIG
jgi:hypothetical protein